MPVFVLSVEDVRYSLAIKKDIIRPVHVTLRMGKRNREGCHAPSTASLVSQVYESWLAIPS